MKEEEEDKTKHLYDLKYFKFLYLLIVCSNSICFHFISKYQDVFTFEPQRGRQHRISYWTYVFISDHLLFTLFFLIFV